MAQTTYSLDGQATPRLRRGALSVAEIVGTSLATVAPAYSLYFCLGLIVSGAGIGAPITILLAGIAMLLHVNTVAEFNKSVPSTGSYATFLGRAMGNMSGMSGGLTYLFGQIFTAPTVLLILGSWTSVTIKQMFGLDVPWWIPMVVLTALVAYLCISGIKISSQWAIAMFAFEAAVLLIGAIAMLATHPSSISLASFNPANIKGGFAGIGLGFPLAIYMFLGVGNSSPLAEEVKNPRKSVPRAVYMTVLIAIVLYVFMAWATIIGYGNNADELIKPTYPLVTAASQALGSFGFILFLAGFTSMFAVAVTSVNSVTRMAFNLAREGALPKTLGGTSRRDTPSRALLFFATLWFAISLVVGLIFGPMTAYDYLGTLGTLPIIALYMVVNIALPVYYLKYARNQYSLLRHMIWPIIGTLAFILPLWCVFAPGQTPPYNVFGYVGIGIIGVAILISSIVTRKRPNVVIGKIIADED